MSISTTINAFFHNTRNAAVWAELAWLDVLLKYRRSTLGPWWITMSMAIFIMAITIVYARLFNQDMKSYVLFFSTGYIIWVFISNTLTEGALFFGSTSNIIRDINVSFGGLILRLLFKNFFIFLHNFVIYLCLIAFLRPEFSWSILLFIPGLFLLVLNTLWMTIIVSVAGARFRDIPPLVQSSIQVIFFLTPVTWMPKLVGENSIIVKLNPFAHFLNITRNPLMGLNPNLSSYLFCIGLCLFGGTLTVLLIAKARKQLAFWV